jgi:alkanesulfonate monooxygenase SsuD/methylene tetrahydromethanopterin reductase-like flavin-dependent oxidoreductase (luciferase family)
MVGAAAPRMMRLTAELADEWNAGMRTPADLAPMLAVLDDALAAADRPRTSIARSAEAMVEAGGVAEDAGDTETRGSWDRPLCGPPATIAAGLRRYAELGCDHVQVQLRPNSIDGLRAFGPVVEALAGLSA